MHRKGPVVVENCLVNTNIISSSPVCPGWECGGQSSSCLTHTELFFSGSQQSPHPELSSGLQQLSSPQQLWPVNNQYLDQIFHNINTFTLSLSNLAWRSLSASFNSASFSLTLSTNFCLISSSLSCRLARWLSRLIVYVSAKLLGFPEHYNSFEIFFLKYLSKNIFLKYLSTKYFPTRLTLRFAPLA